MTAPIVRSGLFFSGLPQRLTHRRARVCLGDGIEMTMNIGAILETE